jgi:thioredoxin 1
MRQWFRASRMTILLGLLLAMPSSSPAAEDELAELARSRNRPVIADFGLGFCNQCKKQSATLDKVREAFGDKVVLRMVNVGKETNLAERYKVEMIPTLVFLDPSGKVTLRKLGPIDFHEIRDQLARMGVKETGE